MTNLLYPLCPPGEIRETYDHRHPARTVSSIRSGVVKSTGTTDNYQATIRAIHNSTSKDQNRTAASTTTCVMRANTYIPISTSSPVSHNRKS